jgi:hypothetical protein
MLAESFLRYNPLGNQIDSFASDISGEPTHAAPRNIFCFCVSMPFRFIAVSASADSVREAKSADPRTRRAAKCRLLGDGRIQLRASGGKDFADRDGIVADGRKLAAADR